LLSFLTVRQQESTVKLSQLQNSDEVLREELRDPVFRAEWERTAPARAVALTVLRYRTEHKLSQRALGRLLGMAQSQVARLEAGEHNPSIEMLMRLSSALVLEFAINIRPVGRPARYVTKRAKTEAAVADYEADDTAVLLAAG
jgi:transcriptional regulator with XRE-family HTH domain